MRGVCRPKRLRRRPGHMTGLETVRPNPRVTAGCSGGDAPAGTFDPFRTSIRDAVTGRVLDVTGTGAASRSLRSTTEARTEGIGHGKEESDHRCAGARLQGAARARGGALGWRRVGVRGARTAERTQDVVRAPAGRQRSREANAVGDGRDVGRGRAARSARADRGIQRRWRCGGVCADDADVRAGVPCRLRGAVEADDQGGARAQHAALHSAGLRQPTHRYDHGARRAELVRRTLGHAGRNGEPVAGGSVVAHEARRGPGAAPGARPEFQAAAL